MKTGLLLNPQPPCARKTFTIPRKLRKQTRTNVRKIVSRRRNRGEIRRNFMRKYSSGIWLCRFERRWWRLVELISRMVIEERKKKNLTSTNNQNIQMNSNKMLIQYLVFKSQYRATVLIFLFLLLLELITNIIKSWENKSFIFVVRWWNFLLLHHLKKIQRQSGFGRRTKKILFLSRWTATA